MTSTALRRGTASRPVRLVVAATVLVLLVVGVVWALFFSSWFTVDRVQVKGVSVLSVEDVTAAAAVRTGAPLVRLDAEAVQARVAGLAPVDEVEVSRSWPHTVVITVVERQPALVVPTDEGFAVYDHEGVDYLTLVAAPDGVPQLATADADPEAVRGVLEVVAELPDTLLARLATVRAETPDSIELDLTDGVVVVWGSAEQSARKADVLVALMAQPASVYIVSAPDAPAIRQ